MRGGVTQPLGGALVARVNLVSRGTGCSRTSAAAPVLIQGGRNRSRSAPTTPPWSSSARHVQHRRRQRLVGEPAPRADRREEPASPRRAMPVATVRHRCPAGPSPRRRDRLDSRGRGSCVGEARDPRSRTSSPRPPKALARGPLRRRCRPGGSRRSSFVDGVRSELDVDLPSVGPSPRTSSRSPPQNVHVAAPATGCVSRSKSSRSSNSDVTVSRPKPSAVASEAPLAGGVGPNFLADARP